MTISATMGIEHTTSNQSIQCPFVLINWSVNHRKYLLATLYTRFPACRLHLAMVRFCGRNKINELSNQTRFCFVHKQGAFSHMRQHMLTTCNTGNGNVSIFLSMSNFSGWWNPHKVSGTLSCNPKNTYKTMTGPQFCPMELNCSSGKALCGAVS